MGLSDQFKPNLMAVVDLGSNSFNLLIVDIQPSRHTTLAHEKRIVQLARGRTHRGELTPEAIERGIDCLTVFRQLIDQHQVKNIRMVATEALRKAPNAQQFLGPANLIIGAPIEIISGKQEAELAYNGVRMLENYPQHPLLVIDIGGASTEITSGLGDKIQFRRSLKTGCVTLADQFFNFKTPGQAMIDAERSLACGLYCEQQIEPDCSPLIGKFPVAKGAAGIMKVINELLPNTEGNITPAHLEDCLNAVIQKPDFPNSHSVTVARPVLASGLILLRSLLTTLKATELKVSQGNIKYGMIHEYQSTG